MNLDPPRQLIVQIAETQGTTLAEMSRTIGRNHAYLHQYVHRHIPRALPEDVREAIAAHYGVDPDQLRGGTAAQRTARPKPVVIPGEVLEMDARGGAGLGGAGDLVNATEDGQNVVSRDVAAAVWRLPVHYLQYELRVRQETTRIIEILGDSMSPTLMPGDRVMLNLEDRVPSPPGIFALWDGLGLVVKRVEHIQGSTPPTLRILSDNPHHTAYERTAEEAHIIGRVVWVARRM